MSVSYFYCTWWFRDVLVVGTGFQFDCRSGHRVFRTGRILSSPTSLTSRLPIRSCVSQATDRTFQTACFERKHLQDFDVERTISISNRWSQCQTASCRRLWFPVLADLNLKLQRWPRHRLDRNVANNLTWNCLTPSWNSKECQTILQSPLLAFPARWVSARRHHLPTRSHPISCFDNTDMFCCCASRESPPETLEHYIAHV